jgi:hypothetical protein
LAVANESGGKPVSKNCVEPNHEVTSGANLCRQQSQGFCYFTSKDVLVDALIIQETDQLMVSSILTDDARCPMELSVAEWQTLILREPSCGCSWFPPTTVAVHIVPVSTGSIAAMTCHLFHGTVKIYEFNQLGVVARSL